MAISCELTKSLKDFCPRRRSKVLTPQSSQPVSMGHLAIDHKSRKKTGQRQNLWPQSVSGSKGCGRPSVKAQASQYTPFAWEPSDYHNIKFCPQPIGPILFTNENGTNAVLTFYREGDNPALPATNCLEVFIAGDTSRCIYNVWADKQPDRPAALDLAFIFLKRGQEISKRDWKLIRFAIVDVKDQAFIGRLFFGDPETGKVVWDCDCRPSDGCYLSLKFGAPMFVNRNVWTSTAKPLQTTFAFEEHRKKLKGTAPHPPSPKHQKDSGALNGAQDRGFWAVLPSDPNVIKLLKRELQVALNEEDYAGAIKIRDHPYMKLYAQVYQHRQGGDSTRAAELEDQLEGLIKAAEQSSQGSSD